jgi:hypothetical protein
MKILSEQLLSQPRFRLGKKTAVLAKKGRHDTGPSGSSVLVGWFGMALGWNGKNY